MALQLLENRSRAACMAGAVAVHLAAIACFMLLPGPPLTIAAPSPRLVAVDIAPPAPPPPPPPPPRRQRPAAAAPPSRGATSAPAVTPPVSSIAVPTSAPIARDAGSGAASGLGRAPGSGPGEAGVGDGTGMGGTGPGRGGGAVSPPVHVAGALTSADYRAARLPRGTAATVRVGFRVRADGAVDQCTVIASSGFAAVDEATCRLIQERFRFRPAVDSLGDPIAWNIRTEYTWAPR